MGISGFSVQGSLDQSYDLQEKMDQTGVIEGTIHRFLLVAKNDVPAFWIGIVLRGKCDVSVV